MSKKYPNFRLTRIAAYGMNHPINDTLSSKIIQITLFLLSTPLLGAYSPKAMAGSGQSTPLKDGRYLYGEQSAVAQVRTTYMVFEVMEGQTVGAFYQPHSSFDCFYGEISMRALDLTVIDSYEESLYTYSLPIQPMLMASQGSRAEFTIANLVPVADPSDTDRQILSICRNVSPIP